MPRAKPREDKQQPQRPADGARPWPADAPERRRVADLLAYPRNPRLHSNEQVDQIAALIKRFGWTTPVLIDEDGMIVAGHGRVLAAMRLGILEVPVIVARGWTEEEKRAYVIADNQVPLNAEWNQDLLRIELGELKRLDFDLALTGFDPGALVTFMANPNPQAPDQFQAVDESLPTQHSCPRCGYRWSGKPDAAGEDKPATEA